MTATDQTLAVVRSYHDRWTSRDFEGAAALLAEDLEVEVPINDYPSKASFAAALTAFGSLTRGVELLSELGAGDEAMLLYDMDVDGLGTMRVAEHFTVADGGIRRIRQIHDTAALRTGATAPADVRRTLALNAAPKAVYDALVQPEGLRGWWSPRAEVSTEAGGLTRFVWSDTDFTTFRIDRLAEPSEIDWTCVEQHDASLPQPDEWVGTTVSFRLAEHDGGTRLDFVHRGLAELECGDVCSGGWDFFLRRSLKALVETGRGMPYEG